ncbi:MAG: DnaJ domain-containing protein [SAR324 cluster bacterium]|nr:DnaJ domain-containing protein [SAR324 cluster bacterium]
MNKYDAFRVLGLSGQVTVEDVKQAYRRMCRMYHPDVNQAGEEMMKMINQAYDVLKDETSFDEAHKVHETDYSEKLSEALNAILKFNLRVEVCGAWVWVSGETKVWKEELKKAQFKWASGKSMWYFRPQEYKSRNRKTVGMDYIRSTYGSRVVRDVESNAQIA